MPCSPYSLKKNVSSKHILPDFKAVPQEFLYGELNREITKGEGP